MIYNDNILILLDINPENNLSPLDTSIYSRSRSASVSWLKQRPMTWVKPQTKKGTHKSPPPTYQPSHFGSQKQPSDPQKHKHTHRPGARRALGCGAPEIAPQGCEFQTANGWCEPWRGCGCGARCGWDSWWVWPWFGRFDPKVQPHKVDVLYISVRINIGVFIGWFIYNYVRIATTVLLQLSWCSKLLSPVAIVKLLCTKSRTVLPSPFHRTS